MARRVNPGACRRGHLSHPDRVCRQLILAALLTLISGPIWANPMVDPELRAHLARSLAESAAGFDRFDAEVWLLTSDTRLARFIDDPEERMVILKRVFAESHRHAIDANLVLAVMHVESAFDRYAISRVGAQGLMQVMPFWRLEIGRPQDNLTDIETNIAYGTAILAHYLNETGGDLVDALARYNGSRGRLHYPERVIGAWRRYWRNQNRQELPQLQASCENYALHACRYQ